MNDLLGQALLDYHKGNYSEDIATTSSLDEEDVIPLPYLFRGYEDMPPLEKKALHLCRGSILDIGCGAGSHCLFLQDKGYDVTALDSSKGAIETCLLRGVENCIKADIFNLQDPLAQNLKNKKFDTLLMLMNGIGIVGRLENLDRFLNHLRGLLKPGGQILFDSSDIIYMYDEDEDGGRWVPDNGKYYGEVEFELWYKGQKSRAFDWLYVDYRTLEQYASANGLRCELVGHGENYDYLARLW